MSYEPSSASLGAPRRPRPAPRVGHPAQGLFQTRSGDPLLIFSFLLSACYEYSSGISCFRKTPETHVGGCLHIYDLCVVIVRQQSASFCSPATAHALGFLARCPCRRCSDGGIEPIACSWLLPSCVCLSLYSIGARPPPCHTGSSGLSWRLSSKILCSDHPSFVLNVPHTLLVPTELCVYH